MNTILNLMFGDAQPVEDYFNNYRCYSFDMHEGSDQARGTLRRGGHILLPQSALRDMSIAAGGSATASTQPVGPMIFKLSRGDRTALAGVREFTAPEGVILVPDWLIRRLQLGTDGDIVRVSALAPDKRPPLGRFAKLRPRRSAEFDDFLAEVDDPKAVLENRLRDFICLSVGDEIDLQLNGRRYRLDVVELRPAESVSIVDCDLSVDFDVGLHNRTATSEAVGSYSNQGAESTYRAEPDRQSEISNNDGLSNSTISTMENQCDGAVASAASLGPPVQRGQPNFDYRWGKLTFPQHRSSSALKAAAAAAAAAANVEQSGSAGFIAFSGSGQCLGNSSTTTVSSRTSGISNSANHSRVMANRGEDTNDRRVGRCVELPSVPIGVDYY